MKRTGKINYEQNDTRINTNKSKVRIRVVSCSVSCSFVCNQEAQQ